VYKVNIQLQCMINETYTANVALCGHFHSYL